MKKEELNNQSFALRETAPLTIKTKSGLSAEGVAVLRSKTQKPVSRRQPSSAFSVYDSSSLAIARASARLVGGGGTQSALTLTPCKESKICYNSDMVHHDLKKVFTLAEVFYPLCRSKRIAFTLAEVLITLGIIGIVAAMVMPGIVDKYQERVLLRQLDVAYSLLSQATEKMINDEGVDIRDFGSTNQERVRKYFSLLPKYLTVVNPDNISKIGRQDYKVFNPATGKFFEAPNVPNPGWPRLALANGMYIFADRVGSSGVNDCSLYKNFTYTAGFSPGSGGGTYGYACSNEIMVDINGAKGPNAVTKDLFPFFLVRDGIIPAGMPKENIWCQSFNDSCGMNAERYFDAFKCTAWALYNKNMDYLRCKGLKWNGKNKCS